MKSKISIEQFNFEKLGGLIPAVVQHAETRQVLMIGFMNREALTVTIKDGKATLWSRTMQRLWQKGETSGNFLDVVSLEADCDNDALLVRAVPRGPVCHTGSFTCFGEQETTLALARLQEIISARHKTLPEDSYTARLFKQGLRRITQKVGEESIEVIIASLQNDRDALREESADLLYHLMVLLEDRGLSLQEVERELERRMNGR